MFVEPGNVAVTVSDLTSGAEDWNRTSDTSIFSAVLYRLSYLGTGNPLSARLS